MFVIDYEKALPTPDYAVLAKCSRVTLVNPHKAASITRWARQHCKSYTWSDARFDAEYHTGTRVEIDFYFWDPADALIFQIKYKSD